MMAFYLCNVSESPLQRDDWEGFRAPYPAANLSSSGTKPS